MWNEDILGNHGFKIKPYEPTLTLFPPTDESVVAASHPDLVAQPLDRVVLDVDHPFLEWDQRVVGDLDVLRT
jgi:hypothetical protein